MTNAIPYWVASCFLAGAAIVGATAATSCSNSARVTTVLQSGALDLFTGGLSHNPAIVITAVAGPIFAAPPAVLVAAAADAVAALGGAGRAAGFAACPQATAAKSNKHNHPR